MEYKGYFGKVVFDEYAAAYHGEVVNSRDVITFQAASLAELAKAFHESVDEYMSFCADRGEEAECSLVDPFLTLAGERDILRR